MDLLKKLFGKKYKPPEGKQKVSPLQEQQPLPKKKPPPAHSERVPNLHLLGHVGCIRGVDGAMDGSVIATGSEDGTVRLWNPTNGKQIAIVTIGSDIGSLALSTDGKRFAVGCRSGTVEVWDIDSKKTLHRFEGHKSYVCSGIAFSRNEKYILSASWEEDGAFLWDLEKRGLKQKILPSAGWGWRASSVAFSPNSVLMAIGNANGIIVYDAVSAKEIAQLQGHPGARCNTLQFLDDETIGSIGAGGDVKIQKISGGPLLHKLSVPIKSGTVSSGAFSSDGKRIIVGDVGGYVSEWDLESKSWIMNWTKGHDQQVMAMTYLPNSYAWVSGDTSGDVKLWRPATKVRVPEAMQEKTSKDRIIELEEALKDRPNWAKGHEQLALLYYDMVDAVNMFRHFYIAAQLDPGQNAPHKYLKDIYAALDRSKDMEREEFEDQRTDGPSRTALINDVRRKIREITFARKDEMVLLAKEMQMKAPGQ